MYINSKAGVRTIKLTKLDRTALEKAHAILGDMGLFCHTSKSADGAVKAVIERVADDGTYKPETPE